MFLPIEGATILPLSDITQDSVQEKVKNIVNKRSVDVVLSDMAPNPTGCMNISICTSRFLGDSATDHIRLIDLCRTVFHLFQPSSTNSPVFTLSQNGTYVCKIWDGIQRKEFIDELRTRFKFVRTVKPNACRDNSAELYLYCSMK